MTPAGRRPVRTVALIDPVFGGHHSSYAAELARELLGRGIGVHLIGPATLLDEVCRDVPQVSGHVLSLMPALPGPDADRIDAYERLSRLPRERANLNFLRAALKMAGEVGADTAHLLWLDGFVAALLVLAARQGRPTRALALRGTLHRAYFLQEFQGRPANQAAHRALLRALGALGVRVMTHSRLLTRRIGAGRLDTVPYPAPPPATPPQERGASRQDRRRRLGIPAGTTLLLAFGGSRHDKGTDLALEALALLPPQFHLLVVGHMHAPEAAALRERTGQLGVAERLHLHLEFVPDEEVEGYFLAADLCLLPYRRNFSGQSGPLGIAASLSLPVLAADVGVLAEMVETYRLGALFAPEDPAALARCAQTFDRSAFAPHTERFQQDHSTQAFAEAVLDSYHGGARG